MKIWITGFVYIVSSLCAAHAFNFDPDPRGYDINNNRNALLTCGLPHPYDKEYKISWLVDGKALKNTSRRYQEGNNLHFKPINKDLDGGSFQCLATHINKSQLIDTSNHATFNIRFLEKGNVTLKSPSSTADILPDVEVVLKCGIDGNPKPNNVTWLKNGRKMQPDDLIDIKSRRMTFRQVRVKAYDGNYTCCAYHMLGTKCSANFFPLRVIDPKLPVFKRSPQDKLVAKGSNVLLHCVVEGNPPPQVSWYFDGNDRKLGNRTRLGKSSRYIFPNGTLSLISMRKMKAGKYTCKATQPGVEVREVSAMVRLAYIEEYKVKNERKYFPDGNFEYLCREPAANPKAVIKWFKGPDPINPGGQHVSRSEGTLVIDKPVKDDEGTYTCVAENIAGKVTKNLTLVYSVRPVIAKLDRRLVEEGSNATWICPVADSPDATVRWFKGDTELHNVTNKLALYHFTMIIMNADVSDRAKYSCAAKNHGGDSRSNSAELIVNEVLKFSPTPRDTCIKGGIRKDILCNVTGSSSPEITWRSLNDSITVGDNGVLQTTVGTTALRLTFENPSKSQSGVYECEVTDRNHLPVTKIRSAITVRVVDAPDILVRPVDQTVHEDASVMFNCLEKSRKLQVEWRHGDEIYSRDRTNSDVKVLENGSLVIRAVSKAKYEGAYTCSYQVCHLQESATSDLMVLEEESSVLWSTDDPTEGGTGGGTTTQMIQTIALSVSGGVAYVLITVALIIYFRGRHRKKRKGKSFEEEEKMLNGSSCNGRADELVKVENGVPMDNLYQLDTDMKNLQYPASNIEPLTVIGKGEFGKVFLSKAPGLFPDLEEDILVMVKSFDLQSDSNNVSTKAARFEFNREINMLYRCTHENLVKLLGVSSKKSKSLPDYLLTEYLEWGILKLCLQASKEGTIPKFNKHNKMSLCCQLACGLEHLSKIGVVHKDIAARNCVVSSQLLVKISVMALSVEGFETEYAQHNDKILPVRWLAPEVVAEEHYTPQSDVWAFAVTCWEIFSLGRLPYDDLTDEEYIEACCEGHPPALPALEGSKRITSLISKCCQVAPKSRPDIKQITRKLQSITGDGEQAVTVETEALVSADVKDESEDG